MNARLSEIAGIVYALKPGDHQAGVDMDSFKMGVAGRRATLIIQFAALTGDAVLTINSGATAGTKTTAEGFKYRLAGAAQGSAGADQFGDRSAEVTSLTLTAATYQNKTLLVEIEPGDLTEGQNWVTPALSAAADALNASAVAILHDGRYQGDDVPTAIS